MYKVKKRPVKKEKPPVLYNILENYTDHDPPGNVMVCGMTGEENLPMHTQILSETYDIPSETVEQLLTDGGVYLYPQEGALVTKGAFVCRVDPTGKEPKQTWVMDVEQYAAAERLRQGYGLTLEEADALPVEELRASFVTAKKLGTLFELSFRDDDGNDRNVYVTIQAAEGDEGTGYDEEGTMRVLAEMV